MLDNMNECDINFIYFHDKYETKKNLPTIFFTKVFIQNARDPVKY